MKLSFVLRNLELHYLISLIDTWLNFKVLVFRCPENQTNPLRLIQGPWGRGQFTRVLPDCPDLKREKPTAEITGVLWQGKPGVSKGSPASQPSLGHYQSDNVCIMFNGNYPNYSFRLSSLPGDTNQPIFSKLAIKDHLLSWKTTLVYSQSDNGHFQTQRKSTVLSYAIRGWQLDIDEELLILMSVKQTWLVKDSLGILQKSRRYCPVILPYWPNSTDGSLEEKWYPCHLCLLSTTGLWGLLHLTISVVPASG